MIVEFKENIEIKAKEDVLGQKLASDEAYTPKETIILLSLLIKKYGYVAYMVPEGTNPQTVKDLTAHALAQLDEEIKYYPPEETVRHDMINKGADEYAADWQPLETQSEQTLEQTLEGSLAQKVQWLKDTLNRFDDPYKFLTADRIKRIKFAFSPATGEIATIDNECQELFRKIKIAELAINKEMESVQDRFQSSREFFETKEGRDNSQLQPIDVFGSSKHAYISGKLPGQLERMDEFTKKLNEMHNNQGKLEIYQRNEKKVEANEEINIQSIHNYSILALKDIKNSYAVFSRLRADVEKRLAAGERPEDLGISESDLQKLREPLVQLSPIGPASADDLSKAVTQPDRQDVGQIFDKLPSAGDIIKVVYNVQEHHKFPLRKISKKQALSEWNYLGDQLEQNDKLHLLPLVIPEDSGPDPSLFQRASENKLNLHLILANESIKQLIKQNIQEISKAIKQSLPLCREQMAIYQKIHEHGQNKEKGDPMDLE